MKARYLKEFVVDSGNRGTGQGAQQKGNPLSPPLGVIEVVHAALKGIAVAKGKGVLTVVDVETRYLPLEKLVLALVHATRKLPHNFQAHTVYVLTEYPLQSLLKRSDFTGHS